MHFFPSGQPIRRVLHSGTIGTTALAICFPKLRLYILTHTNYDRLKAFVKEQTTNFNQKRAENPFVKEVQSPVHETVNSEGFFQTTPKQHCVLDANWQFQPLYIFIHLIGILLC